MLLTELDGFLTGLLVAPEPAAPDEWMTVIWGMDADGVPPFEDPADVQWFAAAVAARRDEIARDLARGRLQPILDVDERNGEVLWEDWINGFAEAVALRPHAWGSLADDPEWSGAWSRLATLIAIAREDSTLDSMAINALHERATTELTEAVQLLYRSPVEAAGVPPVAVSGAKIGRNDPCRCGSGRKHKRCCG